MAAESSGISTQSCTKKAATMVWYLPCLAPCVLSPTQTRRSVNEPRGQQRASCTAMLYSAPSSIAPTCMCLCVCLSQIVTQTALAPGVRAEEIGGRELHARHRPHGPAQALREQGHDGENLCRSAQWSAAVQTATKMPRTAGVSADSRRGGASRLFIGICWCGGGCNDEMLLKMEV